MPPILAPAGSLCDKVEYFNAIWYFAKVINEADISDIGYLLKKTWLDARVKNKSYLGLHFKLYSNEIVANSGFNFKSVPLLNFPKYAFFFSCCSF